jgi:hypothetical protein
MELTETKFEKERLRRLKEVVKPDNRIIETVEDVTETKEEPNFVWKPSGILSGHM